MNQSETLGLATAPSHLPASARIFMALLARVQHGHLVVRTPDGAHWEFGPADSDLKADLSIHDWRACAQIFSAGDIGLAQAWREQWLGSHDLTALLRLALRNQEAMQRLISGSWLTRCWFWLQHQLRPNSRKGSRENIYSHYDIGNPFYRLWLDESMTYSAAVFEGHYEQSLEAAQHAKYQRILDQLGVVPGQTILEVGCGWGGFAVYAATQGIAVHGITISPAQLEWAQARVAQLQLQDWVQLELRDYRDLSGQYDAIVSIEMFEAVGQRYWPGYFRCLQQRLKPGGKALVQSITIDEAFFKQYQRSSDFIREYIFPGGMLPSPERFVKAAQQQGLQHLESYAFGRDYAETLRRWRQAFSAQTDAVQAQGLDAAFQRTWLMYLCYCEAGFDEGRTDVQQFLLQT